jgi:hypothetical protein
MVSRRGPPRRPGDDVQCGFRAGRDPHPPRAQPEPRAVPRAGRTRGFPCSERANPARETSTSNGRRPGFRTVMAAADAPLSVRRSGLALSPMPRPAAAPGMDAAAAPRTAAATARLTARSP